MIKHQPTTDNTGHEWIFLFTLLHIQSDLNQYKKVIIGKNKTTKTKVFSEHNIVILVQKMATWKNMRTNSGCVNVLCEKEERNITKM